MMRSTGGNVRARRFRAGHIINLASEIEIVLL